MESDERGRAGLYLDRRHLPLLGRPQQRLHRNCADGRSGPVAQLDTGWEDGDAGHRGEGRKFPETTLQSTRSGARAYTSTLRCEQDEETLLPVSVPSFKVHAPLPQHVQTNQTIFAPVVDSEDTYTTLITTGNGTVKVATYPRNPSPEAALSVRYAFNAHTSSCTCLELSPTGRYLATGGSDAMINLWDTTEWVCKRVLDQAVGTVRQVSFSWDGGYIAVGSEEGTGLDVAHVETGEYVHTVPTQAPAVCVAWHPNRYWLAYSGDPGGLKIVGAAGSQH